ncbi:hypothetical protein ACFLY2_02535 [Patescibacteria group bacterium]
MKAISDNIKGFSERNLKSFYNDLFLFYLDSFTSKEEIAYENLYNVFIKASLLNNEKVINLINSTFDIEKIFTLDYKKNDVNKIAILLINENNIGMLKVLISFGYDIKRNTSENINLLYYAIIWKKREIYDLLKEHGVQLPKVITDKNFSDIELLFST